MVADADRARARTPVTSTQAESYCAEFAVPVAIGNSIRLAIWLELVDAHG